ncbi:MAG: hypothetical protein KatS3mg090_0378 [Patescibacteria group bacterium]|nr:MAG: hypothetical protein KatS3mg090_0378 [Patescibacteria group bacterium]
MANRSLNRVTLMGNLTRDPELRYTPQGTPVCSFGLATNRSWTTSDGEKKEETQFHRIVAWNKVAELCAQILKKGQRVYVEGRITYRSYQDKDGVEKQVTEIIMDDFIACDSKASRDSDNEDKKTQEKEQSQQTEDQNKQDAGQEDQKEIEIDDDIPF